MSINTLDSSAPGEIPQVPGIACPQEFGISPTYAAYIVVNGP
jgi:hypothetical protein